MTPNSSPPPARWYTPWRSTRAGWFLAAAFLLAGLPLYLRMPPWCDVTLYDVAALNIMRGGVHYRDVFDTNLPGFVWALVGVRRVLGPSTEALRCVDLAVVAGIVGVLSAVARRAGADRAAVAWFIAGVAFFYPFTSEFSHAQRDVWMLLPAAAACLLRLRRAGGDFRGGLVEGVLWGCAVWFKPHSLIPCVVVWSLTTWRLAGGNWRAAARDGLGYLAGGSAVGLLGVGWLLATGTFQPLVDVFRKWNNYYAAAMWAELPDRLGNEFLYFPPYSLLLPVPLLFAALDLLSAVGVPLPGWLYTRPADAKERSARTLLAALFVGWAGQAAFVQRMFHYVHAPEIFLMLAVAAAHRRAVAFAGIAYAAVCGVVWLAGDYHPPLGRWLESNVPNWSNQYISVPRHPLAVPGRMVWWPACFRTGLSPIDYRKRAEEVALLPHTFSSVDPVGIGEVADKLRELGVKEGEILCWHDSPHAVYLELGHRPPFRFMHLTTTLIHEDTYERMKRELIKAHPGIKYVVGDVKRVWFFAPDDVRGRWVEPGPGGEDLMPSGTPKALRAVFPVNLPCVFRSDGGRGRYVIFRVDRPFGPYDDCTMPPWGD